MRPLTVLALDTAMASCSVAVRRGDRSVERAAVVERRHAEMLMPMLLATLADAGVGFADLDLLAATVGPGAFTSLRVGLAAARGLTLATGLPCLGVTSLEALAAQAATASAATPEGGPLLAVIDSRRGDVFAQVFRPLPALPPQPETRPQSLPLAALAALFADPPARPAPGGGAPPVRVAGDAAAAAVQALTAAGIAARRLDITYPCAADVAAVAAWRWQAGERPSGPPEPLYLRPPDTGPQRP
jgi:tRNA threonylcarbamoyladenosine biosynthesis protein TsaB